MNGNLYSTITLLGTKHRKVFELDTDAYPKLTCTYTAHTSTVTSYYFIIDFVAF